MGKGWTFEPLREESSTCGSVDRESIVAAARDGLARYNATAKGGSKVTRALVLATPPDARAGEITDKGYIAQALARRLRSADVERLFLDPAPSDVMVF